MTIIGGSNPRTFSGIIGGYHYTSSVPQSLLSPTRIIRRGAELPIPDGHTAHSTRMWEDDDWLHITVQDGRHYRMSLREIEAGRTEWEFVRVPRSEVVRAAVAKALARIADRIAP